MQKLNKVSRTLLTTDSTRTTNWNTNWAHLALPPTVQELRPPVVNADNFLHLLERRIWPHIIVERQSKVGGGIGIVIANSCFTKHLPHDKRKRIDVNSSVSFDRFVPFNFEVEDLRAHVSFRAHSAVLLLVQTTVRFRVSNGLKVKRVTIWMLKMTLSVTNLPKPFGYNWHGIKCWKDWVIESV